MRLIVFAVSLAALSAGSYWMLTGPLAPSAGGGEAVVTERAGVVRVGAPEGAPAAGAPASRAEVRLRQSSDGVRTRLSTAPYRVTGQTEAEVLASLREGGPRAGDEVFFGVTETELDVRYRRAPAEVGCVLVDVEVWLSVVVKLPEWAPGADADRGLQRDWGRFLRALAGHEDRHRVIAEGGAQKLHDQLVGLRRASCDQLEAEAQRRLQRAEIEIPGAHRRYDAETGHGRTEGAVWPVR